MKTIRREIRAARERLQQGGTMKEVERFRAEFRVRARLHLANMRTKSAEVLVRFRTVHEAWTSESAEAVQPHVIHFQAAAARWLLLGAWCALALEAAFSAALMGAYFTVDPVVAVTAGIVIAILLAVIAKAAAMLYVAHAENAPLAARERLRRWLLVALVIEVPLLLFVLIVRGATGPLALMLDAGFGPATAVLNLVTPFLSGVLFALAKLYGWSVELTSTWQELTDMEREVLSLLGSIGDTPDDDPSDTAHGARLPSPHPLGTAPDGPEPARRLASLALFAALTALGAIPAAAQAHAIFPDRTSSVSAPDRSEAVEALVNELPRISRARGITRWQVIPFSDDAYTALPSQVVPWPLPAAVHCDTEQKRSMFRGVDQERRRRAEVRCQAQRESAAQRLTAEQRRATASVRAALLGVRPGRGGCTSIGDLLLRISELPPGSTAVVITDGIETCRGRDRLPRVPQPAAGVLVVIVLAPSNHPEHAGRADDFVARRDRIRAVASWAQVVPARSLPQLQLERAVARTPRR